MPEKTATRQLILEAVVTCIEKYGFDHVTTRKIAQEAGTNIASINYHFRSKGELLDEALSMTIKHMTEDVFAAISDRARPFKVVLEDVLFYILDGGIKFPGVARAHLYKAVVQRDRHSPSSRELTRVFERLADRAAQESPRRDAGEVRLAIAEVLSAIMMSMLSPDFFPLPRDLRLTNSKNARMLAQYYTRQFMTAS